MRQPSFVRRTLGASTLSLLFLPAASLADDPPSTPESGLSKTIEQAAEQAVEAATEAAEQGLEEAQQAASEAAEAAAEHAQKAAEHAQEAAEKIAAEAAETARRVVTKAGKANAFYKVDSGFQLGLHVTPVPSVLNSQLKLDGKGVLVDNVEPDGPAAKAGIQAYDVLLAVGENPIANVKDLYKTVQMSDGKEFTVKLIRGGETKTVTLTPTKRTAVTTSLSGDIRDEVDAEVRKLEAKIREKLKNAGLDVRMQLIRPGHMLPTGATFVTHVRIPDDVSLIIEKKGEEPAEIKIKRGEESWSAKEGDLSALPPDLRPHVERMLGRVPMPFTIALPDKPGVPVPPHAVSGPFGQFAVDPEIAQHHHKRLEKAHKEIVEKKKELSRGGVERRLEMMSRELERMNEQMQALQRELSEEGKPSPKDD